MCILRKRLLYVVKHLPQSATWPLLLITLCKIWGRGMFWQHQQAIHESFLHENLIFHQFAKVFSHESSRYMVRTLFQIACVDKAPDACSLSCYTVNEGEGQLPISYMMT